MKIVLIIILSFCFKTNIYSQSTWMRVELDAKKMLNPSCNLNMGNVDSNKVYIHLGLCTCNELPPFGPEHRDCSDNLQNKLFCTTQITPFQSRVWQHVVGNWGTTPLDDGIGLMTYEGDSIWSFEIIIENYFSNLNLVQDTSMGNDSSIAFQQGLQPYTIGVVFRDKDGFYSGRDNGCNDIFITGIDDGNPTVIQSTDLSTYSAVTVELKNTSSRFFESQNNFKIYPNPSNNFFNVQLDMINSSENIEIKLYDISGKFLNTLFSGRISAGTHKFNFDNNYLTGDIKIVELVEEGISLRKIILL